MSEFLTHLYTGRPYTAEETISFSQLPLTHFSDISKEMQFHRTAKHVQVTCLTQKEFDVFVKEYADNYESIYFFQNSKVKDLSALESLKNVKFLMFFNMSAAKALWDMSNNLSLRGLFIDESKNLIYDISSISYAPALEELLLFSNMHRKYVVKSLEPIKHSKTLKKVMLICKTENSSFDPGEYSNMEVFEYRVDRHRNF